ncbi:hypothetical protein HMPREF1989_01545 [Porphyromonas gingivalis F0566]|nr:hypothetical protein HMPREF1989_01545 [Porphyromonas gingivalis F0566]
MQVNALSFLGKAGTALVYFPIFLRYRHKSIEYSVKSLQAFHRALRTISMNS